MIAQIWHEFLLLHLVIEDFKRGGSLWTPPSPPIFKKPSLGRLKRKEIALILFHCVEHVLELSQSVSVYQMIIWRIVASIIGAYTYTQITWCMHLHTKRFNDNFPPDSFPLRQFLIENFPLVNFQLDKVPHWQIPTMAFSRKGINPLRQYPTQQFLTR